MERRARGGSRRSLLRRVASDGVVVWRGDISEFLFCLHCFFLLRIIRIFELVLTKKDIHFYVREEEEEEEEEEELD